VLTDGRKTADGQAHPDTQPNKKLSCRKETVRLLHRSVLAKYNWKTTG